MDVCVYALLIFYMTQVRLMGYSSARGIASDRHCGKPTATAMSTRMPPPST